MPRTIKSTGRSIDEAIFNGLKELGISIDEVEIDIIQNASKGILGIGARPAVVKLAEREPEEISVPEYLARDLGRGERRPGRRDRRPRRPRESSAMDAIDREQVQFHQREERNRARTDRQRRRDGETEKRPPAGPPEGFTLEAAEKLPAAEFLRGLLERMGVEGEVLASVGEGYARLYVDKCGVGVIIGRRGETLDAMQYLTSLCVNRNRRQEGYTRVSIDTEGYREKREEVLIRLAHKIAGQVRASGRARTLEPMNPYERRVLHSALQNNPFVATRSEGEEPNRRVIVYPRPRKEEAVEKPADRPEE